MPAVMSRLAAVAIDSAWLLGELLVLFLVVATAVALATRRIGARRLRRLLGASRVLGAIKGIALGFMTPFCTYSAIPVLVALRAAGVRTSAWVGFLLAAPVLDPLVAVAIAAIFGLKAALAYACATFAGILAAALVVDAVGLDRLGVRAHASRRAHATVPSGDARASGGDAYDPLSDGAGWRGWRAETPRAVASAIALIRGMAAPLVVAVVFAATITGFVPQRLIVSIAGPDNPLAVPAAALIGIPFYVSGEAFLPVAAALQDKGMSPGAVFALIVAGAGINVPELGVLARLLAPRMLVALVVAIFATATVAGYVVPAVAP